MSHRVAMSWGWTSTPGSYNHNQEFPWPHRIGLHYDPFTGEDMGQSGLQTLALPDYEGAKPAAYTIACIANPRWGQGLHWNWAEPINMLDSDGDVVRLYFIHATHRLPETFPGGVEQIPNVNAWSYPPLWDTAENQSSYSWRGYFTPNVHPVSANYDPPIPIIGVGLVPPTHVGRGYGNYTWVPWMGMWIGRPDEIPNDPRTVVVPMTIHPIDGSFIPSGWMTTPAPSQIGNPSKDLIIARRFPVNPELAGLRAANQQADQGVYSNELDLDGITTTNGPTPPLQATQLVTPVNTEYSVQYQAWHDNNALRGITDEEAENYLNGGQPFSFHGGIDWSAELARTWRAIELLVDADPEYRDTGVHRSGGSSTMFVRDRLITQPDNYEYPMVDPPEELDIYTQAAINAIWDAVHSRWQLETDPSLGPQVVFAPLPTSVDPTDYWENNPATGEIIDVESGPMQFTSEGTMPSAPEYAGPDIDLSDPSPGDPSSPVGDYGVWGDYDFNEYQNGDWDPSNEDPGGSINNEENQNGDPGWGDWDGWDGSSEGGGWGGDGE